MLTVSELNAIDNWYNGVGPTLLWVTGDSDVFDSFSSDANNEILDRIGSKLRLSTDTIEDFTNNDGAFYRVAAQTPVADGEINSILTNNVSSIIMHGPTSVLGYDNSAVVDLASTPLSGVEVIMKASSSATVVNNQTVSSEFDYYTTNNIVGNYPMVAIEDMGNQKYTLVSGETIFSDYKKMYDLFTERGIWNAGKHDGKNLVDNIFNWFNNYHYFPHAPINFDGNGGFLSQGFVGQGTENDPYIIEGINITTSSFELVHIGGTTAYFEIRNSIFNGLNMDGFALFFFKTQNVLLEGNIISNVLQSAIFLEMSNSTVVKNNIFQNTSGIFLAGNTGAHHNLIVNNTILNSAGIGLDKSTNNTIANNTFSDNSQNGIDLMFSNNNTISNNIISELNGMAIGLSSSHNNTINGNEMSGSHTNFGGIMLGQSNDNEILQNTIFETQGSIDNQQTGIGLGSSVRNLIEDNYIYNIHFAAIQGDGSSGDNLIIYNQLFDNGYGLIINGNNNNISSNLINNNQFGLSIGGGNGNLISQNDFNWIFVGGAHVEDFGTNNIFNGNYWSDWDGSGSYVIDGSANNQDSTPKNNPIHMSDLNLDILASTTNGITSDLMTISWTQVIDNFIHSVEYSVYYSTNDGSSWILITSGLSTLTYSFDTSAVSHGSDTLIKVIAEDEVGFKGVWISDSSYLIANVPHELSVLSFLTPSSSDTLSGTVTVSWSAAIDSWGHDDVFYNLLYSKGVAGADAIWEKLVGELEVTSYDWDTTKFENGDYSLSIEIFSDGLEDHVVLDGVITIANLVETSTSTSDTDPLIDSETDNAADSFVPFNTFNIAILSLITTLILVRKLKLRK